MLPRKTILTPEEVDKVVSLYTQGATLVEIGKIFSRHHSIIWRLLQKRGIDTAPKNTHTIEFALKVVHLYESGNSMQGISRDTGVTYPRIRRMLQKAGISTKTRKGLRRAPSRINGHGYREIFNPGHPNANCDGYVKEHVLIASKARGSPLKKNEVVHHINGNKLDNRSSNLLVCSRSYHTALHWKMGELYMKEHFA